MAKRIGNGPFLHDESSNDVVGVKNPSGSEGYFARLEVDANSGQIFGMLDHTGSRLDVNIRSPRYVFHAYAKIQEAVDTSLYDLSGNVSDGSRGANLSVAQLWATAGFASTIDPIGGATDSVIRFPSIGFDYASGESLCVFWKGRITPEGADVVFLGDSYLNTVNAGIGLRVKTTGKLDFVLYDQVAGNKFSGATTASAFVTGETHSICLFIDGVTRKYAVYVDGAADIALQSLASGASANTLNSDTFNVGTGARAAAASTTGIATQTVAVAVLKRAAGVGLPSDLAGIARSLHRRPDRLISAAAW